MMTLVKIAVYSTTGVVIGGVIPMAMVGVLLLRRITDSVGLAPPTDRQIEEENPSQRSPLIRNLPQLQGKLAFRSLGVTEKSPVHICIIPSPKKNKQDGGQQLQFYVKREDLLSPLYGGNKVRTLQHLLAICESRRDRGERSFRQLVSIGSGGSNQVVATAVHARALGWDGTAEGKVHPCWLDEDKPDLDNTLNMLSVLSMPNIGVEYGWTWGNGTPSILTVIKVLRATWKQDKFVPMMLGGNCPSGVLGQVGAMLELAEQIANKESPDPQRIYVPVGSACTVSGLVIGAVLARRLGLPAFQDPNFKIVGCNVHQLLAKCDAKFNFHTNPMFGWMPVTMTYTVQKACAALKQLGGPDLKTDSLKFLRSHIELKHDADVVGLYGGHSEKTRVAAQLYDENGKVVDVEGKESKNLWLCGHFAAKAFQPLMTDLEQAIENSKSNSEKAPPICMLWMTKSAVQPRGPEDEWAKLLNENETVLKWANRGQAESPKLRPGKVVTTDGKTDDYRSVMTKIT